MEKSYLTSRNLEYNDILIYSRHIRALINLNTHKIQIDKSNNIDYLKKYLIHILMDNQHIYL